MGGTEEFCEESLKANTQGPCLCLHCRLLRERPSKGLVGSDVSVLKTEFPWCKASTKSDWEHNTQVSFTTNGELQARLPMFPSQAVTWLDSCWLRTFRLCHQQLLNTA